ncbi:MAG: recombinase family protein [Oscillospiraceae bacterium]|nr:recombinase family protein [Oscillospiraceae bacterium]
MARKSRKNQSDSTEKINFRIYKTAIYARLSKENQQNETIENQIEEIKDYIKNRRIFELTDIYADNGYSGTNFNRPEFERLMEDVRNRKIDCIIVKDLSRFAREHIGAEDYLNNIFPFLGVRFIAINDGYDNLSLEPQEYFMASFKNLAHSYFAQETSRKVSMAKRELQKQGKFIGSKPSFGYSRDPDDKHKLIINEEEAVIVREIFQRVADGESTTKISKELIQHEDKGIIWSIPRICNMLKNEIYKGVLVQHKTEKLLYKNEEFHKIPKSEQFRSEGTVPAIVTAELWDKVNVVISDRKFKKNEESPENPYKSLVFCGKCGKRVLSGFRRKRADFELNCKHCKGVFSCGKNLDNMVRNHLKLPENTEITKDFLNEKFEKILIFYRKNIVFIDMDDELD